VKCSTGFPRTQRSTVDFKWPVNYPAELTEDHSFWSWFDVNGRIFHEDKRIIKQFLHFPFNDIDLRHFDLKFAPPVTGVDRVSCIRQMRSFHGFLVLSKSKACNIIDRRVDRMSRKRSISAAEVNLMKCADRSTDEDAFGMM